MDGGAVKTNVESTGSSGRMKTRRKEGNKWTKSTSGLRCMQARGEKTGAGIGTKRETLAMKLQIVMRGLDGQHGKNGECVNAVAAGRDGGNGSVQGMDGV